MTASNTYAITSHFCGNHLVDVSLVGKAKACGMEVSDDGCDSNTSFQNNCCSEITELLESDIESLTINSSIDILGTDFFSGTIETLFTKFLEVKKDDSFPKNASPPLINQNFQVLFQTFII